MFLIFFGITKIHHKLTQMSAGYLLNILYFVARKVLLFLIVLLLFYVWIPEGDPSRDRNMWNQNTVI